MSIIIQNIDPNPHRTEAHAMSLSDRIRPGVECAPWVYDEVCCLEAERDRLLARIEDTDSACADYAFAGAHTAREIIEKLHDSIRGYKTDRDLLAEANDQLRAELAECRKDAERYRWLRGTVPESSSRWARWRLECWISGAWHELRGLHLDTCIDAARKGEGEQ